MNSLLMKFTGVDRVETIINSDPGQDAVTFIERAAQAFSVKVKIHGFLPKSYQSTVFLCTHHTGALDFLASFPVLASVAPNLKVVMNRQLLMFSPLARVAIAVHAISTGKKNAEASAILKKHLDDGGNVMLFPAGRVGNLRRDGVVDDVWKAGIVKCFDGKEVDIVPVYIEARNSRFFYWIRKKFPRLSMLFLLRTLKRNKNEAVVYIGAPINSRNFDGMMPAAIMKELRNKTYALVGEFNKDEYHESKHSRSLRPKNV